MAENELPAREAMEFDVVIVGAGPAGLAAAIRLKQRSPDISVVVVEKGSEVGAHILSGAVIDPVGLDRLLPDWRNDEDTPIKTKVSDDRFYWLSATASIRLPNFMMPPLMSNHGNYIVSLGNVCRWLATEAESLGVDIYPGFAAVEVLYDTNGAVAGVATGDMGIGKDGKPTENFTRGMELRAKYTLFAEGARGSLTKTLLKRFGLDTDRDPQKFGIGLKELWQVAPDKHRAGLVQHSFGWPLDNKTGGGSFLYHFDDNLVSVGFVVHLNYENPYINPFEEFQRFKTHPLVRGTFEGGKRLAYGARAITEGGYQSVPKLTFPGGALIGCAAGFVNVPRIKGSHNAMLSGMLAAEHVADALSEGRSNDEISQLRCHVAGNGYRRRPLEGPQRQAVVVALRHLPRHRARRLRHVVQHARLLAVRHLAPRQVRREDIAAGVRVHADRLSETRRQAHLRPALLGVPLQHQSRGEPAAASQGRRPRASEVIGTRRLRRAVGALLPGGRLRMGGGGGQSALRDQRAELRPLQNLRYQGSQPEHHLGSARRRRRTELSEYVMLAVTILPHRPFQWGFPPLRHWKTGCSCGADAKRSFSPE